MENKFSHYEKALAKRLEQKQYQQLRCALPIDENHLQDQKLLNFSSNDYLGLSKHPHVKKTTIKYVLEWGVGSSPSRLLTQHLECHQTIEQKLAQLLGTQQSLLFSSGYEAHQALLTTLINDRTQVFIDRSVSRALLKGASSTPGVLYRYDHNDMESLESLLTQYKDNPYSSRVIISESVTLMNGDRCHLQTLIELAEKYNAILCIDDSHSIGIMGKYGIGLAAHRDGVDIILGSFGKDCGSFGGYIGCSNLMKEYMIHFSSHLKELSALPPAALGSIHAALELIPDMEAEREKIQKNSERLRSSLLELGWDVGKSTTQIIPVSFEDESLNLNLNHYLQEQYIVAFFIKSQTIPLGFSRIAFTVNATHTQDEIDALVSALKSWNREKIPATV